jgi:hypothetical protein
VLLVTHASVLLRFHAIDPIAAALRAVLQQMNQGLFALWLR